jgi:Glycosyltransferase family 87
MLETQTVRVVPDRPRTGYALSGRFLGRAGALIGIILFVVACRNTDRASGCSSDFMNFYSGGRLAFSGQLYSPAAEQHIQRELGCTGKGFGQFVRLPYFALAIWPLAKLPFSAALVIWRVLCAAAALLFVFTWPGSRWRALAVCAWSFPLLSAFVYGQDVPVLLLAVGASLLLLDRGHEFLGGVCLALGAAKPHLFVIWVLLIVVQRRWRTVLGLAAGGSTLLALSFFAGGLSWPRDFLRTVTGPNGSPNPERMINLHGASHLIHAPGWLEMLLAVAFFALLFRLCLRLPQSLSFSLALAAGVLLGGHSYLYDLALCIPLVLLLLSSDAPAWLKWVTVGFASPLVYLLPSTVRFGDFVHLVLPLFLIAVGIALRRRPIAILSRVS